MPFDHVAWRPLHYSMGVEIGSDWQDKAPGDPVFGLYRECGFFSKAEVALLEQVANQFRGIWLEIGAHTGWCTAALLRARCEVNALEPMFSNEEWLARFHQNIAGSRGHNSLIATNDSRSSDQFQFWRDSSFNFHLDGCLIDGDHEAPHPLNDAIGCYERLAERGVIVLHDFRGGSIWEAGEFLAKQGMQYKIYGSVHMVGVFWRGDFMPPPEIAEGKTHDQWIRHYGKPGLAI